MKFTKFTKFINLKPSCLACTRHVPDKLFGGSRVKDTHCRYIKCYFQKIQEFFFFSKRAKKQNFVSYKTIRFVCHKHLWQNQGFHFQWVSFKGFVMPMCLIVIQQFNCSTCFKNLPTSRMTYILASRTFTKKPIFFSQVHYTTPAKNAQS